CLLAWNMTTGLFFEEIRQMTDSSQYAELTDWWRFTLAYLFGYDIAPKTAFADLFASSFFGFWQRFFALVTSFLVGILGIYFLHPPLYVRAALVALPFLTVTLGCLFAFWYRVFRQRHSLSVDYLLLAGAISGTVFISLMFMVGVSWDVLMSDLRIPFIVRVAWKAILLGFVDIFIILVLWIIIRVRTQLRQSQYARVATKQSAEK